MEVDGIRLEHFMSAQDAQHFMKLHRLGVVVVPYVVDDIRNLEVSGKFL